MITRGNYLRASEVFKQRCSYTIQFNTKQGASHLTHLVSILNI